MFALGIPQEMLSTADRFRKLQAPLTSIKVNLALTALARTRKLMSWLVKNHDLANAGAIVVLHLGRAGWEGIRRRRVMSVWMSLDSRFHPTLHEGPTHALHCWTQSLGGLAASAAETQKLKTAKQELPCFLSHVQQSQARCLPRLC